MKLTKAQNENKLFRFVDAATLRLFTLLHWHCVTIVVQCDIPSNEIRCELQFQELNSE